LYDWCYDYIAPPYSDWVEQDFEDTMNRKLRSGDFIVLTDAGKAATRRTLPNVSHGILRKAITDRNKMFVGDEVAFHETLWFCADGTTVEIILYGKFFKLLFA